LHYDDGIFEFKILDDIAAEVPNCLDLEEKENFGATNNVGEYTYWNNSVITTPAHLLSKSTNKLFIKLRDAILDKKLKAGSLPKLNKLVAKLTPPQKTKIREAKQQAYGQTVEQFTNDMKDQVAMYA